MDFSAQRYKESAKWPNISPKNVRGVCKKEAAAGWAAASGAIFMIGLFHQFLGDFTAVGALEVDAGSGGAADLLAGNVEELSGSIIAVGDG